MDHQLELRHFVERSELLRRHTVFVYAHLSFVNPATALSYVVTALISHFWLHEQLTLGRWAAIGLIVAAVGFVASGPLRTEADEVAPLTRIDASEGL
jgi:threonine/homoserine efflux transporter RhtA